MKRFLASLFALVLLVQQASAGFLINSYWFGGAVLPSLVRNGCTVSSADLTTYTFTSHNVGTASATRTTVVLIFAEDSGSSFNVTGVTIGGDAATERTDRGGTQGTNAAIYTMLNTAGTAENIVVTHSEAVLSTVICVLGFYDLTSQTPVAATNAGNNAGTTMSVNVNTNANGLAAGMCADDGSVTGFAWTGLTEDQDAAIASESVYSSADFTEDSSAATPLAITCNPPGSGNTVAVSISMR